MGPLPSLSRLELFPLPRTVACAVYCTCQHMQRLTICILDSSKDIIIAMLRTLKVEDAGHYVRRLVHATLHTSKAARLHMLVCIMSKQALGQLAIN